LPLNQINLFISNIFLGDYHISLTYNGEHIHDSPYYLNLRARPPTATIEPIEFYVN